MEDRLIISYIGYDVGSAGGDTEVLTVFRKVSRDGGLELNTFYGNEAKELYNKLTGCGEEIL
jgi:hypothetical protein